MWFYVIKNYTPLPFKRLSRMCSFQLLETHVNHLIRIHICNKLLVMLES